MTFEEYYESMSEQELVKSLGIWENILNTQRRNHVEYDTVRITENKVRIMRKALNKKRGL